MKVIPTRLPEVLLLEPRVFGDSRGFFFESWNEREFERAGIRARFVQDNHSRSEKGVLRGLHYQIRQPQGKLIRVIAGEIPLVLGVFSHDVERMKAKGAPVNWFVLPPAIVLPSAVAVSRRAPHPNAAALFFDYLLTDGQQLYLEMHRIPANRNHDTAVRRLVQERQPYRIVNPQVAVDDHEKWRDLYKRTIVERSQH